MKCEKKMWMDEREGRKLGRMEDSMYYTYLTDRDLKDYFLRKKGLSRGGFCLLLRLCVYENTEEL